MLKAPPVITLTTDFGLRDPYVGVMTGVIARIAPHARVIDLTHGVEPQNVRQAGVLLATAVDYFPAGAIHVVVVDPGVGSARRPLLAVAGNASYVAPDNGVLSWVFAQRDCAMFALDRPEYWLPDVSTTFHGRDVFAPVAAHLATGVTPEQVGTRIDDPVRFELPKPRREADGTIVGHVQYVDHFGNCITDIPGGWVTGLTVGRTVVAGESDVGPVRQAYADVAPGTALALIGSTTFVEIAVRNGNANQMLHLRSGDPVRVRVAPPGLPG